MLSVIDLLCDAGDLGLLLLLPPASELNNCWGSHYVTYMVTYYIIHSILAHTLFHLMDISSLKYFLDTVYVNVVCLEHSVTNVILLLPPPRATYGWQV